MRSPELGGALAALRARAPLVHCLNGAVTAPIVADGLLAAGARPMLTGTLGEAPTLVRGADALLVNLATLSEETARAVLPTVAAAREAGLGWVLDPAVVGPTPVRTPLAHNLARHRPSVVRGNASEILAMAGEDCAPRGADTVHCSREALEVAARFAADSGCVVVISGVLDVITDGHRRFGRHGGHARLTQVTGTGCLLSALVAAFTAVAEPLDASAAAVSLLATAAERAAEHSNGPGSFKVALLDALDEVRPEDLDDPTRWEQL